MYAHKVIEDLDRFLLMKHKIEDPMHRDTMLYLKKGIKSSFKFHLDEPEELGKMFERNIGKRIFGPELGEYQRMPYPIMWVDWHRGDDEGAYIEDGQVKIIRRGVLAIEVCPQILQLFDFNHLYDDRFGWSWVPPATCAYFSVGSSFKENKSFYEFKSLISEEPSEILGYHDGNAVHNVLSTRMLKEFKGLEILKVVDAIEGDNTGDYSLFNGLILLLNCKNISTQKTYPSKELNQKRIKHGKSPLFTYHTLVVRSTTSMPHKDVTNSNTGIKHRLHFCRGHFKEYTADNPLFGKLTGLYWWQPHVRGNKELGIVHKDYKISIGA